MSLSDTNDKLSELRKMHSYLNTSIANEKQTLATESVPANKTALDAGIKRLEAQRRLLEGEIQRTQQYIAEQTRLIAEKDKNIQRSQDITQWQEQEIEYKKGLMLTRDRQLELSQEKNIYKQKVIYTLMAIVLLAILGMIVGLYYVNK